MSLAFGAMLLGVSAAAGAAFYGIPLWRRRMAEASLRARCTRERLLEDVAAGTFVCRPFGALLDRPTAPKGKTDAELGRSR